MLAFIRKWRSRIRMRRALVRHDVEFKPTVAPLSLPDVLARINRGELFCQYCPEYGSCHVCGEYHYKNQ